MNDWATIDHDLRIVGVGGLAHLQSTAAIDNRKAILITNADVVIENLEFSGARVADRNGAGIRYQAGDLTIKDSYFHDNENGILGAANAAGHIVIQDSEFARNGRGDGYTHGAYIGQVASLEVTGSYFHDTKVGSHLKSRAASSLVEDNRFIDGVGGTSSYAIDLPNGGNAVIRDNLLDQAATASNRNIIHFGGEVANPVGSLLVEDNVFTNARHLSTAVLNQTKLPVRIIDNQMDNITWVSEGGPTVQLGNHAGVLPTPAPEPTPVPAPPPVSAPADAIVLTGTAGNDVFRVDDIRDRVVEQAGAGSDIIETTVTYRLPENVEAIRIVENGNVCAYGNALDNRLDGNHMRNQLEGGAGADTLWGGGGADTLTGGAGADQFLFKGTNERVLVRDFQSGEDRLDLSALLVSIGYDARDPLADGTVALARAGTGTTISIDADGPGGKTPVLFATLEKVGVADLHAEDFRF